AGAMLEPLLPEVPGYMEPGGDFLRSGPRLDDIPSELSGDITPRLRIEDLRFFLPEQASAPVIEVRQAGPALKEVPAEFLQAAEEALRTEYLMDPDVLVPEMAHMQMMRLLEFHAQDARIKLYVLILPPGGVLPALPGLERLASGSLVRTDSCLLAYPLGEPERARLFVSKSVFDSASTRFLAETAEACAKAAYESSEPHDQLQNYTIELSKRLFWLQKALSLNSPAPARQPEKLEEFARANEIPPPQLSSPGFDADSSALAMLGTLAVVAFLSLAYLGGTQVVRWRRRRVQTRVWMLPEMEPLTRLGGAFTGGGGGTIR
ncbi:MAG: hypothetical protein JNG86_07455, partial [Verrucomicrobiaceae bacterium]|nr:hypothetical protein [Verrucomicrobiaceae bacterium]